MECACLHMKGAYYYERAQTYNSLCETTDRVRHKAHLGIKIGSKEKRSRPLEIKLWVCGHKALGLWGERF